VRCVALRGFDPLKAEMGSLRELGSSRESSMQRGVSLDVSYDERDLSKVVNSHSSRPYRPTRLRGRI